MEQQYSSEERSGIIGSLIRTASGRNKLASALQQPLRQRRDYLSVGRKAFLVEQLPDGAAPQYDKDINVAAYYVGDEGESILAVVKSTRVTVPMFEIAALPMIPMTQIKERRFDIVERSQDQGRANINAAEDSRVFDVIEAAAVTGAAGLAAQNPTLPVAAPLTIANLADAFGYIQRHDLAVARIFINAMDFSDILKWGNAELDNETQQNLLRTGLMGTIWGAQVIRTRMVAQGTVYVVTEPEFLGRIPVRQELTVVSADRPDLRQIGFSMFVNEGILCHNPLGVVKIELNR